MPDPIAVVAPPTPVAPATTAPSSKLLSQRRAAHALAVVQAIERHAMNRDFRKQIEGFAVEIRTLGAGQAMALLLKRGSAGETGTDAQAARKLKEALTEWITVKSPLATGGTTPLMNWLIESDRTRYMETQEEMLVICGWLKTFSQAFLPKG